MKKLDDNTFVLEMYDGPSRWWEVVAYCCTLALFAAQVVTGSVYFTVAIVVILLYWNYGIFSLARRYVQHINDSKLKDLLYMLSTGELIKDKDGTISVQQGLTKDGDDETETQE